MLERKTLALRETKMASADTKVVSFSLKTFGDVEDIKILSTDIMKRYKQVGAAGKVHEDCKELKLMVDALERKLAEEIEFERRGY